MERKNFDQDWLFAEDTASMLGGAAEWKHVTLPHDAMIETRRNPLNPSTSAGGYYSGGNYIYRKNFKFSEEERSKTVLLEIEGSYHKTRVYCNGSFTGSCMNGYRGFYADLTPYLVCGENTVEVKVSNSDIPNSRWYSGSGLYRSVWLLLGGDVQIRPDGLRIHAADVAADVSAAEVSISIQYTGKKTLPITIVTSIFDSKGAEAASEETRTTLFEGHQLPVRQRICVPNAKLWSPDEPNLYRCHVTIRNGENILDEAETEFGFRSLQLDPVHGLRINGKETLLRGACIHHDNGVIGARTMLDVELRRVRLLKAAGFNAIRSAHNSASKALLTACDRVGMLVIEESFDSWNTGKTANDYSQTFSESWKDDAEAIVAKDDNHPSVIMYSIGNEIQELGTAAGANWNRRIGEYFRKLDPTRFVTNAVNGLLTVMDQLPRIMQEMAVSGDPGDGDVNDVMTALMGRGNELSAHMLVAERLDPVFSALDVCGYNYMRGRYALDAKKYPNRIIYGSETYGPDIDLNWQYVKELPNVIGDFTWTGWDYIGEAGIGVVGHDVPGGFASAWPTYLAYCGDIDIIGHRRPISYYREIVWGLRKEPYITVQYPQYFGSKVSCTPWVTNDSIASWTWPGYEGRPCVVEVYSGAEEVELFLNNHSLGRKKMERFKAFFQVTYQPGELRAITYQNGGASGEMALHTAGKKLTLRVQPEYGKELIFLPIGLTDTEGVLQTASDRSITVQTEGPVELLGFGSADPRSEESFSQESHMSFEGRALAVLRRTGIGKIHVKISCEGSDPVEIGIEENASC